MLVDGELPMLRLNSATQSFSIVGRVSTNSRSEGASHDHGSGGCAATGPPFDEVGPAIVFDAAFGGEQGVSTRFRPAVPRRLEPALGDMLAGVCHDVESDRQFVFPAGIAAHSVLTGLEMDDASLEGFVLIAVRFQSDDDASDAFGVQQAS